MQSQLIENFEKQFLKSEIPSFQVGDTIRVHIRIVEGEKERIQVFMGTVIAKKGSGLSESFSVYRNAYGSNMEKVFLLHSPKIASIEVMRKGKVRRSKLYYLRGESGKAAKVKEQKWKKPEVVSKVVEETIPPSKNIDKKENEEPSS